MGVVALLVLVVVLAVISLLVGAAVVVDSQLDTTTSVKSSSVLEYVSEDLTSDSRMSELFEKWLRMQGKDYGGVVVEKERRFLNFKGNLRYLNAQNKKKMKDGAPYSLLVGQLNKFADLSNQEFRSMTFTGTKIDRKQTLKRGRTHFRQPDVGTPESIDWHQKGGVDVGVKEQGGSWGGGIAAAQSTKEDEPDHNSQTGLSVEVRDEWEIISSAASRSDVVKFANGTEVQLFPSSQPHHGHVNETRRKLGDFQQCSPCTCCDRTRSWCIPIFCCYNIQCDLEGLPFGLCSFIPISCTCFGCSS